MTKRPSFIKNKKLDQIRFIFFTLQIGNYRFQNIDSILAIIHILRVNEGHQNEQLLKKFIGVEHVFYLYYLFRERQRDVIEAEGLSLAAKDISRELIA